MILLTRFQLTPKLLWCIGQPMSHNGIQGQLDGVEIVWDGYILWWSADGETPRTRSIRCRQPESWACWGDTNNFTMVSDFGRILLPTSLVAPPA